MPQDPHTLPEREEKAVKGDHGRVLVVAGSGRYTNTPAIVALGALRTGVDIVTCALPGRSAAATPSFALNIVSEPLDGEHLDPDHVDTVVEEAEQADCVAIGPGLGREEPVEEAVRQFLAAYDGSAVVDAAALHAAADLPATLAGTVITPHAGEFRALTGEGPGETVEERRSSVQDAADRFDCTVLLKGYEDVVSDGERVETNGTGNPSMTRGGTGDVLTGLTAGLLAQGVAPVEAAIAAARINGAAGDRAVEQYGNGYLLEELIDEIPQVL